MGRLASISSPLVPACMLRFRFCSAALLCIIFVGIGGSSIAYAQTSSVCEKALPLAEEQYVEGVYDEALRLVAACLTQNDWSEEQGLAAYRMLALIHLKRDELSRARAAVLNLFGIDPTYRADPIENPPAYTSLVTVVREDLQDPVRQEQSTQRDRVSFFRRTSTWITADDPSPEGC